jgi:DNA-binding PadR family transcriptional regulator
MQFPQLIKWRVIMARKQLKTLTEPMYYILLNLIEPIHGYGIMKKIEDSTDGRVKVGAGTLYSLLSRFLKEDIVSIVSVKDGKKTYCLTEKGKSVLQDEYDRLKLLVIDGNIALGEGSHE